MADSQSEGCVELRLSQEINSTLVLNIGLGVRELREQMRYQLRHVGGAIELGLGT